MADEVVYKKVARKADRLLEGMVVAKHGKQANQKLKPYVVLQYLLKYSDENNTKSALILSALGKRNAASPPKGVPSIGILKKSIKSP